LQTQHIVTNGFFVFILVDRPLVKLMNCHLIIQMKQKNGTGKFSKHLSAFMGGGYGTQFIQTQRFTVTMIKHIVLFKLA